MRNRLRYAVIMVLFATAAQGQCVVTETPRGLHRLNEFLRNQSQMKVWVSYDRTRYFPMETQKVTIKTMNPTSSALTIPDPTEAAFYSNTECGGWGLDTVRTVVIQPGEVISRTIDSADEKARERSFLPESVGCLTEVLWRGYYHGHAEAVGSYEVGTPVVEAATVLTLNLHEKHPASAVIIAIRLDPPPPEGLGSTPGRWFYLPSHVDSTETPGEHVLLIWRPDRWANFHVDAPPGGILRLCGGSCARLLTLASKFASLDAAEERLGRIRIEYATKIRKERERL
jgi:hypothetical protein